MNFGDRLRELRQSRNLTQPELAESLGIEQSYLSKLENGKSLPSNDVLNRILDVFGLAIGDLVDDLDQGARNRLRQIPDVASHFHRQKALIIGNRRRWLFISAILVAFGAALIYAGTVHLVGSDTIYVYTSPGIVLEGERKEIFREQGRSQPIMERLDRHFLQTRRYRGEMFNIPVDGGTRTYYYELDRRLPQWQNKGVAALGVLLLSLGIVGIILERKLSLCQ